MRTANERIAFRDALNATIATPLPELTVCRRCSRVFDDVVELGRHERYVHARRRGGIAVGRGRKSRKVYPPRVWTRVAAFWSLILIFVFTFAHSSSTVARMWQASCLQVLYVPDALWMSDSLRRRVSFRSAYVCYFINSTILRPINRNTLRSLGIHMSAELGIALWINYGLRRRVSSRSACIWYLIISIMLSSWDLGLLTSIKPEALKRGGGDCVCGGSCCDCVESYRDCVGSCSTGPPRAML